MLATLDRRTLPRPPVSIRLNLWHAQARRAGTLHDDIAGLSCEAVQDYLGFCRAARYVAIPKIVFKAGVARATISDGEEIEEYLFPEKTLVRKTGVAEGLVGHITRYPVEEEADYDVLLRNIGDAKLEFDLSGFDAFDLATGETGLPILIVGPCPAHLIALRFVGYERFFYHQADFPEKVKELIRQIEALYRRSLWPALCNTKAEVVLHGAHFSSQMTPPGLFEEYFLPYFHDFNRLMHDCNKQVFWHADAEMGALLNYMLEAGFDGADCLVCAPLVPLKMEDYFNAWGGRIICWGGLPSTIFEDTFPLKEYIRHITALEALCKGRNDFIFGAADHVMPGAEWERLAILADILGTRRK